MQRACKNCKYSSLERNEIDPMALKKVLFCRAHPPQLINVATPNGLAIAGMFPQVHEDMWCHNFKPSEGNGQPVILS